MAVAAGPGRPEQADRAAPFGTAPERGAGGGALGSACGTWSTWRGTRPGRPRPRSGSSRPAECRRLIAPGGVGRIAFGTLSGPVVVPVNFAVLAGTLVVRTAGGTIIDGHAGEQVALEVDHLDEALCQGWSVLVRGPAHRVTHPAELRRLQEDAAVWPWPGGEREVYVRILPGQITGRRIEIR